MKQILDSLDSVTGWTASTGALIYGLNDHSDYIAGPTDKSLILRFNGTGTYCQKVFSSPVSSVGYNQLVIWVYSQSKRKNEFKKPGDYDYKIDLGTGKDYYLKTAEDFFEVVLDITEITSIERLKITALTDGLDHLVISYCLICSDDIPLDIFVGIQEQIEKEIQDNYLTKFFVGTFTGLDGDTGIVFLTAVPFIDRYSVIRISDGVHTEYHHILERDNGSFSFSSLYDGSTLKYAYTNGQVNIFFPVVFGRRQIEIELPSITVWSLDSEYQTLINQLDNVLDTPKLTGTVKERRQGVVMRFPILIDCEARQDELLAEISMIVRGMIARTFVWINGRKVGITFQSAAKEISPSEEYQIIPKVQYVVNIDIIEDVWKRKELVMFTELNSTVNIE